MEDTRPSHAPISFGVFELDPDTGELRKQGLKVRLQEQPFQILQILLEHRGKVVTREELRQRIWPSDTFVDFNQGLYNATKKLREALGDSADTPRYIETLSRRGYRFIGTVNGNGSALLTAAELPARAAIETRKPRRGLRVGLAICAGAAALLVVVVFLMPSRWRSRVSGNEATPEIRSIAVLPLQNLSGDAAQEYFSDGMTDALITALAQVGDLKVISRTSSMEYKQTKKSLPEIAHELAVDGIVEGTVQRSGDRVRITAQLIRSSSDKHLWANAYERDMSDLFALERDVAGDIVRQVQLRLTSLSNPTLAQVRPLSRAALDAYLQGNSHLHKFGRGFGDKELMLAGEYFRQAINAEPDFAPAYVGLSRALSLRLASSRDDINVATKAAERAVELDPNLSDAWAVLADIKCDSWEWAEAERDYRRALVLNPNDAIAHEHLGWILDALGQMDEGLKQAEMAQQLDPNEDHLEAALDNRRDYDRIIQLTTPRLDADPDNAFLHVQLYEAYTGKSMYKEAVNELAQALHLFGLQGSAAGVREAFAVSGYKSAMRKYGEELERLHRTNQFLAPVNIAEAYAAAGDKDLAFYWLEQAYKRRGHSSGGMPMVFLNRDPGLESLHSDPRYEELLRLVGLPP